METILIKFELHGVTYRVSCNITAYDVIVDEGWSHHGSSEFDGRIFEAEGKTRQT